MHFCCILAALSPVSPMDLKRIAGLLLALLPLVLHAQHVATVASPDGQLIVTLRTASDGMAYDVSYRGQTVMADSRLGMTLDGKALPAKVKGKKTVRRHQTVEPVVPIKFSRIERDYNELTLTMQGGYSIVWRAYDDGVAYRFVTRLPGEVNVDAETLCLGLAPDVTLHTQTDDKYTSAYETPYEHLQLGQWAADRTATATVADNAPAPDAKVRRKMALVPLLAALPPAGQAQGVKVLVGEADHRDYPRVFFVPGDKGGLCGTWSPAWIGERKWADRYTAPVEEAPYIARTQGTRNFPWRYMVITDDDRRLVENTMNCLLSSTGCEIADTSWIRPGQVSWDWWNGKCVYGPDVDFQCGINTATYKYYIDFAAKYGIPYIILDEGWNIEVNRPYDVIDGLDVHELIRYGEERGVGLILWVTWYAVHTHPDIFETYARWGAKGMKIDFMERSDQGISMFYENTVREAARHHLLVDFHGAYTPAGLEFRYPNLMAYEGVRGMENMGGCVPANSIYIPFIRGAVGAMDYTPGAMLSTHPEQYGTHSPNAMSVGTRAYQLALFVTCETGTQMLADSPTQYYRWPDCTEFIAGVPVTWDETRCLYAETGKAVVMAKRKGQRWWLAAMTGAEATDVTVDLSFLTPGRTYSMTAFSDGPNAGYQAMDYRRTVSLVGSTTRLPIRMARDGGFAAVLTDLPGAVEEGVETMLQWRDTTTGVWENAGWWNSANVFTALLRHGILTGDAAIPALAADVYERAKHYSLGPDKDGNARYCDDFENDFYDDQGWWGLAWVEAYQLTRETRYLDMARTIFSNMGKGWSTDLGGGIFWKRNPHQYKNAIANNLYALLAARLYRLTRDEAYLRTFDTATRWMLQSGMINRDSWLVEDGLNADGTPNRGQHYTYNSGVCMAAMMERHLLLDDAEAGDIAHHIAHATMERLATPDGVLCELRPSTEPSADGVQFKGIFMRHLAFLHSVEPRAEYRDFLLHNARTIIGHDYDPVSRSFGCYWYGPFHGVQPAAHGCALDCLVEATALEVKD